MKFGYLLNSFALALREDGTYTPFSSDAWGYAGQMTLLGMGMVFVVLALLMLVLSCFKLVFARPAEKKLKPRKAKKSRADEEIIPVSSAVAADETSPNEIPVYRDESEEELIAVITAAVAAYREAEGIDKAQGFRVVSFKRTGGRAWNTRN